MKERFILLLLILSSVVSAQGVCEPEFVDDLDIRALDANIQPLEGAIVYATYQLRHLDEGATQNTTTDEDGYVRFRLINTEPQPDRVDCTIKVYGTYGKQTVSKSTEVGKHQRIDLKFDVYSLLITVVDQEGKKIKDAEIVIDGINKNTDNGGSALFKLVSGEKTLFITFGGAESQRKISLTENTNVEIEVGLYPITIYVTDDKGEPLRADVEIFGKTYETNNEGYVRLDDLLSAQQTINVVYGDKSKEIEVDLSLQEEYNVFFDLTSPEVSVDREIGERVVKFIITVEDPGEHASGVVAKDIMFSYNVDGGSWKVASITPVRSEVFQAEVPKEPGSIISFKVEVADEEGNKQITEGRTTVPGEIQKPPEENNTQQNQSNNGGGEEPPASDGLPLAVAGLVVAIIVIYGVYRMKIANK